MRKFFNNVLVNGNANYIIEERLMGHDTKLEKNYFKLREIDWNTLPNLIHVLAFEVVGLFPAFR
jgi:hypothetical protein